MAIKVSNAVLLTAPLGGEIVRMDNSNSDGTARQLTLTNDTKDDIIVTLPDLGTGSTKTIWTASQSNLTRPLAILFIVDPHNSYDDDLLRDSFAAGKSPCITVEISTADAVAGVLTTPTTPVNEAVVLCIDVYREFELKLPSSGCRSTISTTSQDKAISKIRARSNMVSGFGQIKVRGIQLG
jgi:hypothetical protein